MMGEETMTLAQCGRCQLEAELDWSPPSESTKPLAIAMVDGPLWDAGWLWEDGARGAMRTLVCSGCVTRSDLSRIRADFARRIDELEQRVREVAGA